MSIGFVFLDRSLLIFLLVGPCWSNPYTIAVGRNESKLVRQLRFTEGYVYALRQDIRFTSERHHILCVNIIGGRKKTIKLGLISERHRRYFVVRPKYAHNYNIIVAMIITIYTVMLRIKVDSGITREVYTEYIVGKGNSTHL